MAARRRHGGVVIPVSVSPARASLTLTGIAPTLSGINSVSVSPTLASLALAGVAPSVYGTVSVSPTLGSLALAGVAPTITSSSDKTATPTVAALTLTGSAPTVTATNPQTVTPSVRALVLTGVAPTATSSGYQTVTPTVAALVKTGIAPTVTATNHKTATPTRLALTLTRQTPTVTATGGATSFYIAPTGSDTTGSGTIGSPWRTVQKFINSSPAAGATLYCRGGTYTSVAVSRSGFGSPTLIGTSLSPITIRNYPGETPLFVTGSTTDGFLEFGGTSAYVVVDGLQSTPAGDLIQTGIIYVGDDTSSSYRTHHITFRNCKFYLNPGVVSAEHTGHAVYLANWGDSVTVEDCELVGPGAGNSGGYALNAFHAPGATNILFQRNIVHGWRDPNTGGFNLGDSACSATVLHNTFVNNISHIRLQLYASALVRNNAGDNSVGGVNANLEDDIGTATKDHNFFGQTFDASYFLLPGNTGINAASDGTDAGAKDT